MDFQKGFGKYTLWGKKLIAYVWYIAFNSVQNSRIPAIKQRVLAQIYLRLKLKLKILSKGFRNLCSRFCKTSSVLGSLHVTAHTYTNGQVHTPWTSAVPDPDSDSDYSRLLPPEHDLAKGHHTHLWRSKLEGKRCNILHQVSGLGSWKQELMTYHKIYLPHWENPKESVGSLLSGKSPDCKIHLNI